MKLFIGQVVLFAVALIVMSDALPTSLLKLLEQNAKRSANENLMRMLAAELDAPVRRSACTYNGVNYDFDEVIFMIEASNICYVKYCDQNGNVAEKTKSTCVEPKVTSAPRRPEDDNGMPEIGGK